MYNVHIMYMICAEEEINAAISQTANLLTYTYGLASSSRLLNITGLFCKRDL